MKSTGRKAAKGLAIGLGVVLGAAVVLAAAYLFKMRSETGQMSPVDSRRIVDGVYAIEGGTFVNLYIVETRSGYIAFDAAQDEWSVRQGMARLGLDPRRVEAVFLTHTDRDHVGALPLFPGARVYLSREEEQMIDGTTRRAFIFRNSLNTRYELLSDGQAVNVSGVRVTGILTPGHTPGAMSYLVNGQYLFTGDTLSLKDGRAYVFNEFFNMDTAREKDSIATIARMPGVRYVFTAHYGYSGDFGKAFAGWRP